SVLRARPPSLRPCQSMSDRTEDHSEPSLAIEGWQRGHPIRERRERLAFVVQLDENGVGVLPRAPSDLLVGEGEELGADHCRQIRQRGETATQQRAFERGALASGRV